MDLAAPASSRAPGRNLRALMKARLPDWAFAFLRQAGRMADRHGMPAFVVGGFVRDLLLGRSNLDLDLVVEGDSLAFARALSRGRGARIKAHKRFGTAILIFPDGFKVDVAMARTESYRHPAALPTVQPGSIEQDLYRRDFTINTLAIRLSPGSFGELLDLYGGCRDLKARTIRVLHDLSFVDDPTRVFRAIRFEQRYGFQFDRGTRALIKNVVTSDLFAQLSGHRLREELVRVCSETAPHKAIARLHTLNLLRVIHPELGWSIQLDGRLRAVEGVLKRHRHAHPEQKIDTWLVFFLALMEGLSVKAVREILKRLAFPARQTETIRAAYNVTDGVLLRLARHPPLRPSETYRALAGLPEEVILFMMAKTTSPSVKRRIGAFLTRFKQVKPSLTGADLRGLGLKPGPIYKTILGRLLDARLDGEVTSDADERKLAIRIATRQANQNQAS